MKISITGESGFVGQNLSNYLKESNMTIESLSVRFKPNQTFELNSDTIIHLAGKAHDLKKVSLPSEYYESNFELTKQLFNAFLESDASIFIYMSSVKAAADEIEIKLTEDFIPNPKTHYGISKLQAENYILSKEIPANKRFYILRPCMIHGPGNKGNLNLLYQIVKKGIPWPLGSFENQRSFLSIENLNFIIRELIENNNSIKSGIYNIADNDPISTNKLIQIISNNLNKKIRILKISKPLINSISKLGDKIKLPLNTERLKKLTDNYIVSNKKILNAINKDLPISSEEGLRKTILSFKK